MILSNVSIHEALDKGWLKIEPTPEPRRKSEGALKPRVGRRGSVEDFLSTGDAAECPDEESDWDKDCSQGEFGPE